MPFKSSPGFPLPYGPSIDENGVNFSIFSKHATNVALCLFEYQPNANQAIPLEVIPLSSTENKSGNVWHIFVHGLKKEVLYAFQIDQDTLLLDPYCKSVATGHKWGEKHSWLNRPGDLYTPLSTIYCSSFDWQNVKSPSIALQDLIIYEMHVRGFTNDSSSKVQNPGTFLGIIEKIPHLLKLGINAIELMPICEFNELEHTCTLLETKKTLYNYWGYSTVNFFSPMSRYGSTSEPGAVVSEFKAMVKELHKNGMEVILDMVFNHTSEGGPMGPTTSFRGIEDSVYYIMDKDKNYLDYTGCGNTFNCNHPVCIELILSCMRHWVLEMHVDGFRFDLASVMTRGKNGEPLASPPLIDLMNNDPVLSNVKLIAEPWDAGSLYQVGSFPLHEDRWSEWNGKYRDCVRNFIKGSPVKELVATRFCGSQDLYGDQRQPFNSVNFITAHDGFTLADLVSYNQKHNLENGEDNRDGLNENESWNCGVEGYTEKKEILALRQRQMRNYHLTLMISQGVPLLHMGDEYGHTKFGNNNTYCQDNALSWFLWDELENSDFFRFYCLVNHLRKTNPLLHQSHFLSEEEIEWHGVLPLKPHWNQRFNFVAFTIKDTKNHEDIYIAFNANNKSPTVTLPSAPPQKSWHCIVNTSLPSPNDIIEENQSKPFKSGGIKMGAYSAVLFKSLPT